MPGCALAAMIADIFDMEIQETVHADASTVGAAILGGMGAGIFTVAKDGARHAERFAPIDARRSAGWRYAELYPQYLNLYRLLSGRSNV